jgi:hypothetical protein
MHLRKLLGLSAILLLGLTPFAEDAIGQQATLKEQIVGTWSVVSWEQTRPDGQIVQAFGANPIGMNTFDASGHFSLVILRRDLPKVAGKDRMKPTPEEALAIATGLVAYFGTYSVNEPDRSIRLDLEGTSYVNQLGRPQMRLVTAVSADELRLRNPASTDGGKIELVLKRAK